MNTPQGDQIDMSRVELPLRRESVLQTFEHDNAEHTVGIGFYPDGRLGELFLDSAKIGSDVQTMLDDAAVSISRNLQHGDSIRKLAAAFTKGGLIRRALEIAAEIAQ